MRRYDKKEIAKCQLQTAVTLFLNNKDLSSAVTLAGAAANILHQLVVNAGKEPFIDFACKVHNDLKGKTPPRKKYLHFVDQLLGIAIHKHMSNVDEDIVQIDLQELQQLGGWSNFDMVLRYAHLSSNHLKNAASRIAHVTNMAQCHF